MKSSRSYLQKYIYGIFFILFLSSPLISQEKGEPKRVYADIVGDLFHSGHIEFFKKAKQYGDYLVIGVLADEDVQTYKRTPIMSLQERVEVIKACKYVDEVIVAPPLRVTKEWLEDHKIDIVVHGDDFDEKMVKDQYRAPLEMGIFRSVPYTKGISTTNLIERATYLEKLKKK